MFKRAKKIISNKLEMGNYIEGYDVYNSLFLKELLDPTITRIKYKITNFEYRPDLIAKDIYGSEDYMAIFLVQVEGGIDSLQKGNYLSVVPKEVVDAILEGL